MLSDTKELRILITAHDRAKAVLLTAGKNLDGFQQKHNRILSACADHWRSFAVAAGAAFALVAGGIAIGLKEYAEHDKALAQVKAGIESTGGAAKVTAKELENWASTMQRKTAVDDEAILSMQSILLTFPKIRNEAGKGNDIFNQASAVTLDLSRKLGKDLSSSAIMVGKALQDPVRGCTNLRRVGVMLTKADEDYIKVLVAKGDQLGAQKVLLHELQVEVGGSAEAYRNTLPGAIEASENSLRDLEGELVKGAAPALKDMFNNISKLLDSFSRSPSFMGGFSTSIKLIATTLGSLGPLVGSLTKVFATLTPALSDVFSGLLSAVLPVVKIIADAFAQAGPAIRTAGRAIGEAFGAIGKAFTQASPLFTATIAAVITAIAGAVTGLAKAVQAVAPVLPAFFAAFAAYKTIILAAGAVTALKSAMTGLHVFLGLVSMSGLRNGIKQFANFQAAVASMATEAGATTATLGAGAGGLSGALSSLVSVLGTTAGAIAGVTAGVAAIGTGTYLWFRHQAEVTRRYREQATTVNELVAEQAKVAKGFNDMAVGTAYYNRTADIMAANSRKILQATKDWDALTKAHPKMIDATGRVLQTTIPLYSKASVNQEKMAFSSKVLNNTLAENISWVTRQQSSFAENARRIEQVTNPYRKLVDQMGDLGRQAKPDVITKLMLEGLDEANAEITKRVKTLYAQIQAAVSEFGTRLSAFGLATVTREDVDAMIAGIQSRDANLKNAGMGMIQSLCAGVQSQTPEVQMAFDSQVGQLMESIRNAKPGELGKTFLLDWVHGMAQQPGEVGSMWTSVLGSMTGSFGKSKTEIENAYANLRASLESKPPQIKPEVKSPTEAWQKLKDRFKRDTIKVGDAKFTLKADTKGIESAKKAAKTGWPSPKVSVSVDARQLNREKGNVKKGWPTPAITPTVNTGQLNKEKGAVAKGWPNPTILPGVNLKSVQNAKAQTGSGWKNPPPISVTANTSRLDSAKRNAGSGWPKQIVIPVVYRTVGAPPQRHSGGMMHSGGVTLHGGGALGADEVIAILKKGEYVIQSRAVEKYGTQVFDLLNSMRLHGGGTVAEAENLTMQMEGTWGSMYAGVTAFYQEWWSKPYREIEEALMGITNQSGAQLQNWRNTTWALKNAEDTLKAYQEKAAKLNELTEKYIVLLDKAGKVVWDQKAREDKSFAYEQDIRAQQIKMLEIEAKIRAGTATAEEYNAYEQAALTKDRLEREKELYDLQTQQTLAPMRRAIEEAAKLPGVMEYSALLQQVTEAQQAQAAIEILTPAIEKYKEVIDNLGNYFKEAWDKATSGSRQLGGRIYSEGLYRLHTGEYVSTAREVARGGVGNTYNVHLYDPVFPNVQSGRDAESFLRQIARKAESMEYLPQT